MSTFRTIAAVLATAALAAPAAAMAQPTDIGVRATQAQQPKQNLSSPDARDAANGYRPQLGDAASNAREQDLRHLRAGGDGQPPLQGQPSDRAARMLEDNTRGYRALTIPTVASAVGRPGPLANPQPVTEVPAANVGDSGDGIDWATIGLGVAGSLLAVSGIAALTSLRSRRQRGLRATD